MDILKDSTAELKKAMAQKNIKLSTPVTARALGISEALGDPAPYKDFALQKGVEKLMDVEVDGAHGQAFTTYPSKWHGTIEDVLNLPTDSDRNRALLIGTINAVARLVNKSDGTVHCKDREPDECGIDTAQKLDEIMGKDQIIGIIGYQPALLKHIAARFGVDRVRITDLNPDNIGEEKFGVTVWDGDADLEKLAEVCDLAFATGSSLANGSTERIIETFKKQGKEVIFFGTTIAGPASLLNLKRICPMSC